VRERDHRSTKYVDEEFARRTASNDLTKFDNGRAERMQTFGLFENLSTARHKSSIYDQ